MYGENIPEDIDRLNDPNTVVGSMSAADTATTAAAVKAAAPAPAMDPAAIAKANLLERIRAARTSAGTSNLPAKPPGK